MTIETRDRLFTIIFLTALVHALWAMSIGWTAPLASNGSVFFHIHEFRQSQNAIAVYWMLQGGQWIDWEIPVFGPPWSMPLELPLYQWAVAMLVKFSGLPIEQAGRWVGAAFFFGMLGFLYLLLKDIGWSRPRRLIALTLVLVCPVYIFWSRAIMIESTALFFGVAYLYAAARFFNSEYSYGWLLGTAVAGMLAALAKLTTYAGFAFGLGLYVAWRFLKVMHENPSYRSFVAEAGRGVIVLGLPLVALWLWTEHADMVKSKNPLAEFQTSGQVRLWLTGTLAEKYAYLAPSSAFMHRMADQILGGAWPLALLAVAVMAVGPLRVSLLAYVALGCFFVVLLVFTKVHAVHNYYQYANAVFLLVFIGIIADQLLEQKKILPQVLGMALIGGTILSCLWTYHRAVRPAQTYTFRPEDSLTAMMQAGTAVQELTHKDDILIVYGLDWNPFLPFYSNRRSLMTGIPALPDPDPARPAFQAALFRIKQEGRSVGAAAFCGSERNTRLKPYILMELFLLDYAAYSNLFCDVYVQRWPVTTEPRRHVMQQGGLYVYAYQGKLFAAPVRSPSGEYRWFRAPMPGDLALEVSSLSELPTLDPTAPELIGSHRDYNIVLYAQRFYGLPQKLGPFDLTQNDPMKLSEILVAGSRVALIALIEAAASESEVTLLLSIGTANIVKFRGRYYSVPQALGEVRWQEMDVATLPGVLVGQTIDEIVAKARALRTNRSEIP